MKRSKNEILEVQERVGAAIRAELPSDWTYFCSIADPEGRHYMLAKMPKADLNEWLKKLPKRVRKEVVVEDL